MITLIFSRINSLSKENFETADNSDLSVSLSNWLQTLNQSMWVPLKLIINNFGSLTFKTIHSDFIALFSSSFFFTFSCISMINSSIRLSSSSVAFYFPISLNDLSQGTSDFLHRNVVPRHSITIFIFLLFYFFETSLVISKHYFLPLVIQIFNFTQTFFNKI